MMTHTFYRFLLFISIILFMDGCGVYESSPLIVSIRSDDSVAVESFIDAGEDVNALSLDLIEKQYWKLTPLIRASISGNVEIMKMLIEASADVNGKDEWGHTALMATAEYGHVEAAKLLIKSGANVDATKPDQTTALMIAARNGNFKIAEIVLDGGVDVNRGGGGETALSLAVWQGNASVVELLVKNGAEVTYMVLKRAREKNHHVIIRLLENAEAE